MSLPVATGRAKLRGGLSPLRMTGRSHFPVVRASPHRYCPGAIGLFAGDQSRGNARLTGVTSSWGFGPIEPRSARPAHSPEPWQSAHNRISPGYSSCSSKGGTTAVEFPRELCADHLINARTQTGTAAERRKCFIHLAHQRLFTDVSAFSSARSNRVIQLHASTRRKEIPYTLHLIGESQFTTSAADRVTPEDHSTTASARPTPAWPAV